MRPSRRTLRLLGAAGAAGLVLGAHIDFWLAFGQGRTTPARDAPPRMSLPSDVETRRPVVIDANELVFDRDKNTITARGNVMIFQGDRIVFADEVIYDRTANRVIATGNVALMEPGGNTVFAARAELTRDLKEGVLEQFRLLFAENSKMAANSAIRTEGNRTEMSRVVFSPCRLCAEDPTRPPFWQLKARKVVHDQTTSDITYTDAVLEIFGQPVFYTPWLRHPDPTVRRRSGFLVPVVGSDSRLGRTLRVPYFWVIDGDKDATITPMLTTGTGGSHVALFGQYRHRFPNGALTTDGSITFVRRTDEMENYLDGHRWRGHLFGRLHYDIDANWRAGFDAGATSDRTYLRRYDIFRHDTLTSTAWGEGFWDRHYALVRGYHFRSLRFREAQGPIPYVLPLAEYYAVGQPHATWGRWHFYGSLLGLHRDEGAESRRLSLTGGWRLPYVHPSGWLLTATATINTDLYWVNGNEAPGLGTFSGVEGRIFPQIILDWRYPFVREFGNVRQVIEPRVALLASPPSLNTWRIPNEDSVDFEFDDTNLFAANRYPGRDRIDDGVRLVYGLGTSFHGNRGGRAEFFAGQSWRWFGEDNFLQNSGLRTDISDYVGRVRISPAPYLNLAWRFRVDVRNLGSRRHEVGLAAGGPPLRVGIGYLDLGGRTGSGEFDRRRQLNFSVVSQLTENWAVSGAAVVDLERTFSQLQSWSIAGEYKNECCTIRASFSRSFDDLADSRPNNRVFVSINFKYLGEVAASQ